MLNHRSGILAIELADLAYHRDPYFTFLVDSALTFLVDSALTFLVDSSLEFS
ncbi:MAG: hypothetical protein PHG79_02135 [Methanosarcina sp.]|nr:hypothetical protein [Methanosarcina sp.]MDD3873906.1 hypothetical protein [Methanosarcina sp.]MDD4521937.1 hypothetical protein [Methanosarcina sp.]HHV23890.1 hypothetical protein [Methanosarcina sp.]